MPGCEITAQLPHGIDRVGDDGLDRFTFVGNSVYERCVRAVLEQPAHEVRQQVLVAPDRRVDAAGAPETVGIDDLAVERLAHAVQTLKLVLVIRSGEFHDARNRVRIVGRKLRVEELAVVEKRTRGREIRYVRVDLARKHRVVLETKLLGVFDFRIPVGAF